MQFNILKNTAAKAPWLVIHPLSQEDSVTGDRSAHYLSEVTEENATETQMKLLRRGTRSQADNN
jgi:hypothetical protein